MLETMVDIAKSAGQEILAIYETADFGVEMKADDSPLTRADLAAHHVIVNALGEKFPEIPVLSEESTALDYAVRQQWQRYFLVDPLDGTKEFIARNGEFTVNIALIDHEVPALGVVHVPVTGVTSGGDVDGQTAIK